MNYENAIYLFIFSMFIHLAAPALSCGVRDLVPRPGLEPGPPALGARSLTPWTAGQVRKMLFKWNHSVRSLSGLAVFSHST